MRFSISKIETVVEKHAPFVTYCIYKIKGKMEAWVTDDFLQAIKERNFLLRASAAKNQKKWNHGGRRNSFILIFLQSISWVDHKSKISALKHVRFLIRYRQF